MRERVVERGSEGERERERLRVCLWKQLCFGVSAAITQNTNDHFMKRDYARLAKDESEVLMRLAVSEIYIYLYIYIRECSYVLESIVCISIFVQVMVLLSPQQKSS